MAESATSILLQTLKDLVVYGIKMNNDAALELDLLQKELEEMNNYLQKVSEKKSGKEFRDCENDILKVVYKAEDLIESYVTQEKIAQSRTINLNLCKINLVIQMKQLRMRELRPTFENAKSQLAELSTSDESAARTKSVREVDPLDEKTVVGMVDEIDRFINDLTSSSEVEAICIVGMPGLGKSTIASAIYGDSRIIHHFPTRVWVNVSEDYKKRDIYLNIVKGFIDRDMSASQDSELARIAKKHLSQVKFLLVMDDVWTAEAWEDIKKALPINQGSGKVLVTSRHDNVAAHANPRRTVNRLRFLTSKESWSLLQVVVYDKQGDWPKDSEEIGEKISEKCGGLPLAIVVIGGILKDKLSPEETREDEWRKVFDSAESYLLNKDMVERVKSIVGLSYYKMPYYLRACFLYLGVCPKDFEISAWKLTRLWIAEGLIKEEKNSELSLEDIAEENLMELIRRNLVMVGKRNARGEAKTCRVHDVIREFCKNEALSFLKVISKSITTGAFHPEISEIPMFRRICVHSHVLDLLKQKPDGPLVRSFICFSKHEFDAEDNTLQSIVEAFKLLRVFEGSSIRFPTFDPKITQLIHLRYISLATGNLFKALPPIIVQLLNLQTLVIVTSHQTFEIRANISEMTRLRHLKTKAAIVFKPGKSHMGSNNGKVNEKLQTLGKLSTECCTEETLSKTPYLQTLGISGDVASLYNVSCFQELHCLKRLKITNVTSPENPIPRLLEKPHFPPNLETLTLSATNLEWHYMRILGLLKLKVLRLKDYAFIGDEWSADQDEFRNLRYLEIERSNLISWTMKEGCLENLKSLRLYTCEKLFAVPLGLAKSLKTLEMGNVSANAVHSAKAIEKERSGDVGAFTLILAPGTYLP